MPASSGRRTSTGCSRTITANPSKCRKAETRPRASDAIRADTAYIVTSLLRGVVQRGTAVDIILVEQASAKVDMIEATHVGLGSQPLVQVYAEVLEGNDAAIEVVDKYSKGLTITTEEETLMNKTFEERGIDVVAEDVPDLLQQLDGHTVIVNDQPVTLQTETVSRNPTRSETGRMSAICRYYPHWGTAVKRREHAG